MFVIKCSLFCLVAVAVRGAAGLVALPQVKDNDIKRAEQVIRSTINALFASLAMPSKTGNQRLQYFTLVHHYLTSLTLQEYTMLLEIAKLTRVDKKAINNRTQDFIAALTELEDSSNDEANATKTDQTDRGPDEADKFIDDYVTELEHKLYYANYSFDVDVEIVKLLVNQHLMKKKKRKLDSSFWKPDSLVAGISSRRIYRGHTTRIKYYPFMAVVQVFNQYTCAGCIIKSDLVITAASCLQLAYNNRFFRENPKFLSVRVGTTFYQATGEKIGVLEVYFHPSYNPTTLNNNLAIMRLHRKINFKSSSHVKKIDFDREPSALPGNTDGIIILGWGAKTGSNKIYSATQNKLSADVIDFYPLQECREVYGKQYVTRTNFCGGYFSKGGGACNRDVGGPGVVRGVLAGIISFGSPVCGAPDAPTVFTKLGYYTDWIEEIMDQDVPSRYHRTSTTSHKYMHADPHTDNEQGLKYFRDNFGNVMAEPSHLGDPHVSPISHQKTTPRAASCEDCDGVTDKTALKSLPEHAQIPEYESTEIEELEKSAQAKPEPEKLITPVSNVEVKTDEEDILPDDISEQTEEPIKPSGIVRQPEPFDVDSTEESENDAEFDVNDLSKESYEEHIETTIKQKEMEVSKQITPKLRTTKRTEMPSIVAATAKPDNAIGFLQDMSREESSLEVNELSSIEEGTRQKKQERKPEKKQERKQEKKQERKQEKKQVKKQEKKQEWKQETKKEKKKRPEILDVGDGSESAAVSLDIDQENKDLLRHDKPKEATEDEILDMLLRNASNLVPGLLEDGLFSQESDAELAVAPALIKEATKTNNTSVDQNILTLLYMSEDEKQKGKKGKKPKEEHTKSKVMESSDTESEEKPKRMLSPSKVAYSTSEEGAKPATEGIFGLKSISISHGVSTSDMDMNKVDIVQMVKNDDITSEKSQLGESQGPTKEKVGSDNTVKEKPSQIPVSKQKTTQEKPQNHIAFSLEKAKPKDNNTKQISKPHRSYEEDNTTPQTTTRPTAKTKQKSGQPTDKWAEKPKTKLKLRVLSSSGETYVKDSELIKDQGSTEGKSESADISESVENSEGMRVGKKFGDDGNKSGNDGKKSDDDAIKSGDSGKPTGDDENQSSDEEEDKLFRSKVHPDTNSTDVLFDILHLADSEWQDNGTQANNEALHEALEDAPRELLPSSGEPNSKPERTIESESEEESELVYVADTHST